MIIHHLLAPPLLAEISDFFTIDWHRWFAFPGWSRVLSANVTFGVILVGGLVLGRFIRVALGRNRLGRPYIICVIALAVYFGLLSVHARMIVTQQDFLAVMIQRGFVALMLFVLLRFTDRLLVVPILTRGGKAPLSRFIHQIAQFVLFFFFTLGYLHWAFDFEISSLLAGSAIVSIILGLALQETLGNFFSGMVLQASPPFTVGDWIQIGDLEGRVVEMTWRAVTLCTGTNNNVLIPNSVIAKDRIINYHTPTPATLFWVTVGVDYKVPPNDVCRVLTAAAAESADVLTDPAPGAVVASFGDSAITYTVLFWINEPNKHRGVEAAVRNNVWYRLRQAGYAIPFPMRTVELIDSNDKQKREYESDVARRRDAIYGAPLFSPLTDDQKQRLARDTRDLAFAAGQILYRQGDPGSSVFVLLEGVLDVFMKAADGKQYDVDDITAVAHFGELSAMTDHPRAETIRAKTDVRVIEITRDHVRQILKESPHLADRIAEGIAARHAEREAKLHTLSTAADAASPQTSEASSASSILGRMMRLFSPTHDAKP